MTRGQAKKIRADRLLVERGLAGSREKAQAMILAGQVLAGEQKVEKSGAMVNPGTTLRLLGEQLKYVSRGGLKLEGALDHFSTSPGGRVCLDIGASTGGFTDCLLTRGAWRVIAVDAGTNQLALEIARRPARCRTRKDECPLSNARLALGRPSSSSRWTYRLSQLSRSFRCCRDSSSLRRRS